MQRLYQQKQTNKVDVEKGTIQFLSEKQSEVNHLDVIEHPTKTLHKKIENSCQTTNAQRYHFQQTNPFYHIHRALQYDFLMMQSKQKPFKDTLSEVLQMRQMCENLLNDNIQQSNQCQKALVMDLQELQTRRVDLDRSQELSQYKSSNDIKDNIGPLFINCEYRKCDEINTVLIKALTRIQQLTSSSEELLENLQNQKSSKQKTEMQNQFLRSQIASLDEKKCIQIQKLKKQINHLKNKSSKRLSYVHQYGSVNDQNLDKKRHQENVEKSSQQNIPKRMVQKAQIIQKTSKETLGRLKNKVYL